MRRAWLCGWSVDCEAFARLCRRLRPHEQPQVFPATRVGLLAAEFSGCTAFGGYSLGGYMLLARSREVVTSIARSSDVLLLAPFLAYPKERGFGGRVRRAQLELVRRAVHRDPVAAVHDFHKRSSLSGLAEAHPDPDVLVEGLGLLAGDGLSACPPAAQGWRFLLGSEDPLLDAQILAGLLPASGLTLVPGAGHEPAALLAASQTEGNRAF